MAKRNLDEAFDEAAREDDVLMPMPKRPRVNLYYFCGRPWYTTHRWSAWNVRGLADKTECMGEHYELLTLALVFEVPGEADHVFRCNGNVARLLMLGLINCDPDTATLGDIEDRLEAVKTADQQLRVYGPLFELFPRFHRGVNAPRRFVYARTLVALLRELDFVPPCDAEVPGELRLRSPYEDGKNKPFFYD
jgi:hypothetical protein